MATRDQNLGCTIGDDFSFAVVMLPYPDGTLPDLTGATASWALQEGNFTGAAILIQKTTAPDIFVNQDDNLNWQIVVSLEAEDTINIPRGIYYQQTRIVLGNGVVSHVEGGAFALGFTAIP
jgi:hypothetical protein